MFHKYIGSALFFFFGFSMLVLAQDDFQEGFVIDISNDTLYGKISDRKTGAFSKIYDKIRFKGERKKKRFAPRDILYYEKGNTLFKSVFLNGEMTFVKVITESYVNHYRYEFQEQGEQLVQDIDYVQKGKTESLLRANQGLLGLKKKRLSQFFSDCPDLVTKIQNKEFKYVFEVVDFYNNWKASH